MRIDAHHHLWDLSAVHYPWILDREPRFFGDHTPIRRDYLLDEFRRDAEQYGFSASVHIQVGADNSLAEARWIQSICEHNPDWSIVQVAFCDLTADDFESQLTELRKLSSLRGVRQIVGRSPEEDAKTGTNDLLDNPKFLDGLQRLADLDLSFDLQLIPELIPRMAELLAKTPETKVALCHAGSPYDRSAAGLKKWKKNLRTLESASNVVCKLSGLGMFDHDWTADKVRPIVETCIDVFGKQRLMFGSNFPVDSLSGDYGKAVGIYENLISEPLISDCFGATASRFYSV